MPGALGIGSVSRDRLPGLRNRDRCAEPGPPTRRTSGAKRACAGSALFDSLRGSFKGDIDIDVDTDIDVEVHVVKYFDSVKGGFKVSSSILLMV